MTIERPLLTLLSSAVQNTKLFCARSPYYFHWTQKKAWCMDREARKKTRIAHNDWMVFGESVDAEVSNGILNSGFDAPNAFCNANACRFACEKNPREHVHCVRSQRNWCYAAVVCTDQIDERKLCSSALCSARCEHWASGTISIAFRLCLAHTIYGRLSITMSETICISLMHSCAFSLRLERALVSCPFKYIIIALMRPAYAYVLQYITQDTYPSLCVSTVFKHIFYGCVQRNRERRLEREQTHNKLDWRPIIITISLE